MRDLRGVRDHLLAQRAGGVKAEHLGETRHSPIQPFAHFNLRLADGVIRFPQRVVEIESDEFDHYFLGFLARGWAASYTLARCWKSRCV